MTELTPLDPDLARALLEAIAGRRKAGAAADADQRRMQALLEAVPVVEDGDVIRAEQWNGMRAALMAVTGALDDLRITRTVVRSFTPVLLPRGLVDDDGNPTEGAWRVQEARAVGPRTLPEGNPVLAGWMPLDLPDGTDIGALLVRGERGVDPPDLEGWHVWLNRYDLTGADLVTICDATIEDKPTKGKERRFQVSAPPLTEDLTAEQLAERRRIDTSRYRYTFSTWLVGDRTDRLAIDSVQVLTTRS